MDNMNQTQAISVLIQGVQIGQRAGVYSLEDAELIAKAIKVFKPISPEKNQQIDNNPDEVPADKPESTKSDSKSN